MDKNVFVIFVRCNKVVVFCGVELFNGVIWYIVFFFIS